MEMDEQSFEGTARVIWETNEAAQKKHESHEKLCEWMKEQTRTTPTTVTMWATLGLFVSIDRGEHPSAKAGVEGWYVNELLKRK